MTNKTKNVWGGILLLGLICYISYSLCLEITVVSKTTAMTTIISTKTPMAMPTIMFGASSYHAQGKRSTETPTETPTEMPTAIVPTAIPDKWLNIDMNTDIRSQFNTHIMIKIRILSVIEIKDFDYDRNTCKNPVPEGAKGILVNIEAKNVGEDVVTFPSDFLLNDKYRKKSDDVGFCLKKSTIKYPSGLNNAYPEASSSFATLRFQVPVAFDMETAFMSARIYTNNQIKSFHFYQ